jgi:O-antigen/teichoic acid export membrane protein
VFSPTAYFNKFRYSQGYSAILARGAVSALVIRIAGCGLLFALHVLIARLLGPEQYGIYIYAITWINILGILCLLGFGSSLVRFIAEYNIRQQWGLLHGLLRRCDQIVLGLSVLVSLLGILVICVLSEHLSGDMRVTFYIAFGMLPISVFCSVREVVLRGLKHIVPSEFLLQVLRPGLTGLVFAGLFLITGNSIKSPTAMTANLLAIVITAVIGAAFVVVLLPKPVREAEPHYDQKTWLSVSIPLLLIAGMHIVLKRTDIIMLGMIKNSETAGIYSAATRLSDLVIFGLAAVNAILAPMISELFHSGNTRRLQNIIFFSTRGIFVFSLSITIILAIFGKSFLGIFGTAFVAAYPSLLILLGGQMVNASAGSVGYIMTMTGNQNLAGLVLAASAALNIVLNYLLIPRYGTVGAAVSTALTMALWNVVLMGIVLKQLNINPTIFGRITHTPGGDRRAS